MNDKIKLMTVYPFVDDTGRIMNNLVLTYACDIEGNKYYVKQLETGIEYDSAIDVAEIYIDVDGYAKGKPKYYTYEATNKKIEQPEEEQVEEIQE